jgi:hypothetical protein
MSIINRRGFLQSLAASPFFPRDIRPQSPQAGGGIADRRSGRWFIAKQGAPGADFAVDFWSTPSCQIDYASHLPAEIVRGVVWYDSEAADNKSAQEPLNHTESLIEQEKFSWLNARCKFAVAEGRNGLSQALPNLFEKEPSICVRPRTALLALDSSFATATDPAWADMIPSFRRHYDRIIGHFHIAQRGFHYWQTALTGQPQGAFRFEQFFTKAASQCDAIVFTAQSLTENDDFLSARASTEELVAELMRRFGRALLDREIVTQVAPIDIAIAERTMHPGYFAIGSMGMYLPSLSFQPGDLGRQRELVFCGFGKPVQRPLLIGLDINDATAQRLREEVAQYTSNIRFLKTTPSSGRMQNLEWLEFVTLWPFDPDHYPWP